MDTSNWSSPNDYELDMSKAYDRVEWRFIEAVMTSMGFDQVWIQWIMGCVTTVTYSFILNGEPRGQLVPSRGLRQGDSISPYLFLLCSEGLSRMLTKAEESDQLHGVKIASDAPSINHLFFADDSFIFMKAEDEECGRLKDILKCYEDASGQQVNFQKSKISFSKNVSMIVQEELAAMFGVERVDKHDKYLGLPTEVSYSKTEAFQYIMEKTRNKMKSWKDKTLSMAGKEVMIKSVVQSVPTYVMSCFELPKHLCQEMHRCMAEFWWGDSDNGRKIHWIAWDKMCVPKEEGGLGFRNMELFNQALLAKQGWRILRCPDSLLARTLRAKYFPNSDFLHACVHPGDSYTWRSLMKGKDLLVKGVRYQVGSGEAINVWSDPWIPRPYTFKPFSAVMEGLEDMRVADLIDPETRDWMVDWLEELFFPEEVELITKIPLSLRNPADRLIWHYDKHGLYNVKSGYHVARCMSTMSSQGSSSHASGDSSLWKTIWAAKVQPKRFHPRRAVGRDNRRMMTKWVYPPRGRLKINVDGAFRGNNEAGGVGVVVRDEQGRFKGAWSRSISNLCSAYHSEAEACRVGLLMAIRQGWRQVEFESDCSTLVEALNNQGEDNSEVASATSGHEILRESIGDGVSPNANSDQPSLEHDSPVISPSQNGFERVLMAKRAKQMKASAKLTK
ncbi:uncharacterized protein LOC133730800 [Rosa rugosa]|uniref:uncharacterized protein LOC133730800 n=1 Tax=Rosa rugosa TaxID=74645 RepID=UPI002B4107B1|nr:uncharacterized protein LOC133730800 [Rosa rugosa]